MVDLKKFRKDNGLTQSDIASYLGGGVEKGFISQIEHGARKLPDAQLAKLLNNDKGWDTSMLINNDTPSVTASASGGSTAKVSIDNSVKTVADIPPDVALLKAQIDSLTEQINLLKAELQRMRDEKDKYWEMIDRLTKK